MKTCSNCYSKYDAEVASTCPSCGSKSTLHARTSDIAAASIVDDAGDSGLVWGTGDKQGLVRPEGGVWREPTKEEVASRYEAFDESRMTTLDHIHGYRVLKTLGVVSAVGAMSGWTAQAKGSTATRRSYGDLNARATELGANAVIGISASAFGAGGGITSIVGGDAVGVLYIGTAVVVEEDDN